MYYRADGNRIQSKNRPNLQSYTLKSFLSIKWFCFTSHSEVAVVADTVGCFIFWICFVWSTEERCNRVFQSKVCIIARCLFLFLFYNPHLSENKIDGIFQYSNNHLFVYRSKQWNLAKSKTFIQQSTNGQTNEYPTI